MVCAFNVDQGEYDVCVFNVDQGEYDGLCIKRRSKGVRWFVH